MCKNNRIKDELKVRGMNYQDLANVMGVTKMAVYKYTKGPTLTTLNKIAQALGCSARDLLPDSEVEVKKKVVRSFNALIVVDGVAHNCSKPEEVVELCKGLKLE